LFRQIVKCHKRGERNLVSKKKLLLADDSITIQKVVNLTFADEGIEVISVGDGDSAMSKILETSPDLVMLDVNMPGLNGYEICEHLRKSEQFKQLPVILLVGSFEPFDEDESKRVGANDYLTKPFQSIRQLVNTVTSLLDSYENTNIALLIEPQIDEAEIGLPESKVSEEVESEIIKSEAPTADYPDIIVPQATENTDAADFSDDFGIEKVSLLKDDTFDEPVNLETGDLPAAYLRSINFGEDILETEELPQESIEIINSGSNFHVSEEAELDTISNETPHIVEAEIENLPIEGKPVSEEFSSEEKSFDAVMNQAEDDLKEENIEIATEDFKDEVKVSSTETNQVDFVDNSIESKAFVDNYSNQNLTEADETLLLENLPLPESASILDLDENNLLEIAPREEDFLVNIEENNDFDSEIKFKDSTLGSNELFDVYSHEEIMPDTTLPNTNLKLDNQTIDEIVRQVIEKLSDTVIREVAWEVIPPKADLILKQIIEEKLENS
jgi:CheY-like chemotaxis protein